MKHINELSIILNKTLNWHKARATCLAQIICGVIATKSTNLAQVSLAMCSKAKPESSYRRIQRFIHSFKFDQSIIFRVIESMFPLPRKLILVMDRTNWQFGKAAINFLVISIAYRGIAIPLVWFNLSKAGGSNFAERKKAVEAAIGQIGLKRIKYLLADREFVGTEWFDWLIQSSIRFVIRVKKNNLVKVRGQKELVPIESLFRRLGKCKKKKVKDPIGIGEHRLYVSASRNPDGELLIVAMPKYFKNALQIYKRRWEIELLFGSLKTRGFCLEETKITRADRTERLFFILSIAFCWSYVVGIEKSMKAPIRIIGKGVKEYSLFRYGYDCIRSALLVNQLDFNELRQLLKLLNSRKKWRISDV